jgi:phosphoribosylformylglycinamidine synthase II
MTTATAATDAPMTTATNPSAGTLPIHRIEVRPRRGHHDPRGQAVAKSIESLGLSRAPRKVEHTAVYLIQGELTAGELDRVANELLADCVTQSSEIHSSTRASRPSVAPGIAVVEVHPLPGVTDPAAESVQAAILALTGRSVEVRTGDRYDLHGVDKVVAKTVGERLLANPVIHAIHTDPYFPSSFPKGAPYTLAIRDVPLTKLSDAELEKLSREGHLFLSLDEMRALQAEYRRIGREPREIELETLAQTWSEHCVHKTLKSTVRYRELANDPAFEGQWSLAADAATRPNHEVSADGTVTVRNLLKSTVAASTFELIAGSGGEKGIDWCLSVFVDNSGVVAFDDTDAVCFKCETHNRPSAIEPYGGAATGIGGCIRDIIGTGLGAKPIAATDVFCVAYPDVAEVPQGCLDPKRILTQVVAGVRDYGNRMGIPTLNGAVSFDDNYVGNPLVYCGCIGLMPRSCVKGATKAGDAIVAVGGRTGRDGIHGATFSSAELTDKHADEFSHAVQIGNAITEKKVLDAILAMRDRAAGPLYSGLTDCGAGGFSSAVGEMAGELGATVHLDRAPTKYDGLSPTEVWISEAQERLVLAVPRANLAELAAICADHGVEWCELGEFGLESPGGGHDIALFWHGTEVGRLSCEFLHGAIPMPVREAVWDASWAAQQRAPKRAPRFPRDLAHSGADAIKALEAFKVLEALLAHPNIASKASIIRQYDHEVQGSSVLKPLVGVPVGSSLGGPGDAAVIRPKKGSDRALAIANGLATGLGADPYAMAIAAIDECVRNLVCVGADPTRIAILDNFCWPSCKDPRNMGALVRACAGCYDAAKAYRAPFISGKDSLNNQFVTEDGRTIQIPPTLLISGFAPVEHDARAVSMDAKRAGSRLVAVGRTTSRLGGSHFAMLAGITGARLPMPSLVDGPRHAARVSQAIRAGLVRAAHDCSEGGLLVAAAEMAFSGGLGLALDAAAIPVEGEVSLLARLFAEDSARYLLEVDEKDLAALSAALGDVPHAVIGSFDASGELTLVGTGASAKVAALGECWSGGFAAAGLA